MTKQISLFLSILFVLNPVLSQCTLYKLDLFEKIANSQLVVEGRVVAQTTFETPQRNDGRIYTASVIELYKVFKGQPAEKIVIVTQGGRLGDRFYKIEPSLKLTKGQVGMFFAKRTTMRGEHLFDAYPHYESYGGLQGFVQYDEWLGNGADVFQKFDNINQELYQPIIQKNGRVPIELRPYSVQAQKVVSRMSPVIDSVSTDTISAGTQSMLTIYGENFEAYDAGTNSLIFFRSADNGGATLVEVPVGEIVNWTNTEITLYLPEEAGSGDFRIQNASGLATDSPIDIFVPFSHINIPSANTMDNLRRGIDLQDANGGGGYTLALSTSAADGGVAFSTSDAHGVFDAAATSWCGVTGFNTMVGPTTALNAAVNDGVNSIMFDNDSDPLPAGTLAQTVSFFNSCDGGNVWYLLEFDIRFRRDGTGGITWNFTNEETDLCCYDFQSVAIHELGHAHLLSHVIGTGDVMHYAIANGQDTRSLNDVTDSQGGGFVLDKSEFLNTCDGAVVGMLPCSVLPVEWLGFEGKAKAEYNQLDWTTSITSNQSGFEVERSTNGIGFQNIGFVPIESSAEGVYTFQYADKDLKEPTYYYRLTAVGINGEMQQSEIVEIFNPLNQRSWNIYPNPATDKVSVTISQGNEEAQAIVHLIDIQGRSIYEGRFKTSEIHSIPVHGLSAGVYLVRIQVPSEGIRQFSRFVKK